MGNTNELTVPFTHQSELADLLAALRDCGVGLGDEPAGWPPAAVFDNLRSKGLLSGKFKALSFQGDGKWAIRDR